MVEYEKFMIYSLNDQVVCVVETGDERGIICLSSKEPTSDLTFLFEPAPEWLVDCMGRR